MDFQLQTVSEAMPQNRSDGKIEPFRIAAPEEEVVDLRRRLALTRWPDDLSGAGWNCGVPLSYLKKLEEFWRTGYDWRTHEARLNELPQFRMTSDEQTIHFVHVRSSEPGALPLMLIHGWPGSVVEFLDVISPFSNPGQDGVGSAFSFQ